MKSLYLGIEAGGTHTVALLADDKGHLVKRLEAGPANFRLISDRQLRRLLKELAVQFPQPTALALGFAGARTTADRARLGRAAAGAWPGVPNYATNDLETALMAAPGSASVCRVLLLSGTGSCCYGRTPTGESVKVGGWGHILGDKGSGFEIGLRALKAVVYYFDRDGVWPTLGERILRALLLNEPDDLIAWIQTAPKNRIAALATEVFAGAAQSDRISRDILKGAAHSLARDAADCARRLVAAREPVEFVFSGSVLQKQPGFASQVRQLIKGLWKNSRFSPSNRESAWGAVELAKGLVSAKNPGFQFNGRPETTQRRFTGEAAAPSPGTTPASESPLRHLLLSPTEQRNPRSMALDKMAVSKAIELMLDEDERIPQAIRKHAKEIEQVIRWIVAAFHGGGRLFYVGAGTSGRLGVLDASECPPTFRTEPDLVQGIIAGGQHALWQAVEGAEDDPVAGAKAIESRGVRKQDVVIGIAASGRTPFVWGALRAAKKRGAKSVLLCFNPNLVPPPGEMPHRIIPVDVGPEILTGSTRLKSGTATKLILNMFTTLAMVRVGKVLSNLMVDVKASNEKLKDRAARIVVELAGVDYGTARAALEKTGWDIKKACKRLG